MKTTLVTGATGFLGQSLLTALPGHVSVLTRRVDGAPVVEPTSVHSWDPEAAPPPKEAFRNVDAVIHLAGEPVAGRWTAEKKRRIRDSRVLGTRHLVQGLSQLPEPPKVLISASAIGYYGHRPGEVLHEKSGPGSDFLAQVCTKWEDEARAAEALGTRVVTLRLGIVLGPGGALGKMLPAFRAGIGGRLSTGQQWMSWVHRDDAVGMILLALREPALRGPVNAVSPGAVTNGEFTRVLGEVLNRPTWMPVPKMALRALWGEMADAVLASQRVVPEAVQKAGYQFRYAELKPALAAVTGTTRA